MALFALPLTIALDAVLAAVIFGAMTMHEYESTENHLIYC